MYFDRSQLLSKPSPSFYFRFIGNEFSIKYIVDFKAKLLWLAWKLDFIRMQCVQSGNKLSFFLWSIFRQFRLGPSLFGYAQNFMTFWIYAFRAKKKFDWKRVDPKFHKILRCLNLARTRPDFDLFTRKMVLSYWALFGELQFE